MIPKGTPMDPDRRAMREASARLLEAAKGIHGMTDDSCVVWGLSGHAARALANHLDSKSDELERHLESLRDFRESVL